MPESLFPTQGGRYEIDSKGNLKQVEAPTQDPTYDRGDASAPAISVPPIAEPFIVTDEATN